MNNSTTFTHYKQFESAPAIEYHLTTGRLYNLQNYSLISGGQAISY